MNNTWNKMGLSNIKTNIDNLEIKIYSSLGKMITKKTIKKGIKMIDFNTMPKGIYLVQLINNSNIELRKIVIQ